ncbi:HNH endonuclease [Azohydromonas aeria]|uniref:HNH endonuclease n=1 Tax=Azohydromonas aeria TaxID=2590212 RepID=UPI0012F71C10|nr:HNH endonuclease [Azohydromonas aeria]
MKFWVGTTDNAWFKYQSKSGHDEVNFWQPNGAVAYKGLEPGSLFLFKLKKPHNHIAGGGFFVRSTELPLSVAWDTFGPKNGAASFSSFANSIRSIAQSEAKSDPMIGCTVLTMPFFWPEGLWIREPLGWSGNIVRGRYYDSTLQDGASLWAQVQERLGSQAVFDVSERRFGEPRLVTPRLGQGAFRVLVTDAYSRRCAITGESTLPVLDAAHIVPYAEQGPHAVTNGMLLRTDFHKLFDLGLVTVTPDLTVQISSRIREEWFNGKAYYRLNGSRLASIPKQENQRPSPAFLQWHNEQVFRP